MFGTRQEGLVILKFLPFMWLYAEIHYRFKHFISFIKRRRPEIIFDVPPRVEQGRSIPILVSIKDADKYPVCIDFVQVHVVSKPGNKWKTFQYDQKKLEVRDRFREIVINMPVLSKQHGEIGIQGSIHGQYLHSGKQFTLINDNYPGGFRGFFTIKISKEPLPAAKGWVCGDIHCHSCYTDDQIEFGAGLQSISRAAGSVGYDWIAITDHSYDLDDFPGHYLRSDPSLRKWKSFLEEVDKINASPHDPNMAILVPGEEVSCGSSKGRNIHLVVLGNRVFVPGFGDSAEKWFRIAPTQSFTAILERLSHEEPKFVAIAAHPFNHIGLLKRFLFNRSKWEISDLGHKSLHGWQIWNRHGTKSPSANEGIQRWTEQLLKGKKIPLVAGSDSHGNFGVNRTIGVPFLWVRVARDQNWAKFWTLAYAGGDVSTQSILNSLREGRTVVSSGPFAHITVFREGRPIGKIGETVSWSGKLELELTTFSSEGFGPIIEVYVYLGVRGDTEERLLLNLEPFNHIPTQKILKRVTIPLPYGEAWGRGSGNMEKGEGGPNSGRIPSGYLRAWVKSSVGDATFEAFTSPIWLGE